MLYSYTTYLIKNAFNDELYKNLTALLQQSSEDRSVSAIVITGTGEYFTSGADLRETNVMPADDKSEKVNLLSKPVGLFMVQLLKFPKVVCAAVNGKAVGIGVTLLLHCDLCYCTESATFWVRKLIILSLFAKNMMPMTLNSLLQIISSYLSFVISLYEDSVCARVW